MFVTFTESTPLYKFCGVKEFLYSGYSSVERAAIMQEQLSREIVAFTTEELEELRRFDAEIDAAPMTFEDYQISDFVEDLLFPGQKRSRQSYERYREWHVAYGREYRTAHQEEERRRKQRWYQENKERVRAQQRAYRQRKAAEQRAGE